MSIPGPSGDTTRANDYYLFSEILCNGTETRLIDCSAREIMRDDESQFFYFRRCNLNGVSCRQLGKLQHFILS